MIVRDILVSPLQNTRFKECPHLCYAQEIYLEKNGTSQLGITLGYDTKTSAGHLYICEVNMLQLYYLNSDTLARSQ